MKNSEIIPLAESTTLRFIDELNELVDAEVKAKEIKKKLKNLKRSDNPNRREIKQLYEDLNTVQFKPDYMCLIIDKEADYWTAYKKGFTVNNIKYKRLLGTTGGVKGGTIVFVSEKLHPQLRKRINNGRNLNVEMVPAKFGAYEALVCSSSVAVSDPVGILVVKDCEVTFKEDIIKLSDENDGEPLLEYKKNEPITKNINDGWGLMSPTQAKTWGLELGLDYIPSGLNSRAYSFNKGMLVTFDFIDFAKTIAKGNYFTKDAWGNEVDVRKVSVVLTTSMLKLWDSYSSCEEYMKNCKENNYKFCVAKVCPDKLENERNLNYQFLQSYRLDDEQIQKLIQPTIDEINDVLGGDYRKSILFLKGLCMNENNIENLESDYTKALMINKNMIDDPYVRSHIHYMIKKRINEAKTGVVKVNGNFQIACGDPYALCQSIFNLEVTGLLKAGDFYSQYWSDKKTKQVACFRAPMTCHNNIRKLNISDTEEQKYWFKYIRTMLIFNSWDSSMDAMNGEDGDGDQNFTSDNSILLENIRPLLTIMCMQRKAPKKIFTEDDLVQSNIDSFGDDIGMYTNGITGQFDVQSQFEVDSKEHTELEYRIMCGQLFQQNAIDKTKGIIAKPRPKDWFDYCANKIREDDSAEVIAKKTFYKTIVADKKPYFMKYIYPQLMKTYNDYVESSNQKCICEFKLSLPELIEKPNKTTQEYEFLKYYKQRMPVGDHKCVINKICWIFEKEFDEYLSKYKLEYDFDYRILKSDVDYSPTQYKDIEYIYQEYCDKVQKYQQRIKRERVSSEDSNEEKKAFVNVFVQECTIKCPNEKQLANIVLDMCYSTNRSKQFAWDVCGKVFIDNLLGKSNDVISYPEECDTGDISFGGKQFKINYKIIGGNED